MGYGGRSSHWVEVIAVASVVFSALGCSSGGGDGGGTAGASGAGSGGTGGGGGITCSATSAPVPPDECALLSQADVQTADPAAEPGTPQAPEDMTDTWVRTCNYSGTDASGIELVLFGALTQNGYTMLSILASTGPGDGTSEPVSGVGDKAVYWEDAGINTRGVTALSGCYSVDVTAYFVDPAPTKEQLTALVSKAIGAL